MVSNFGVRNRKLPLPCLCWSLSSLMVVSATGACRNVPYASEMLRKSQDEFLVLSPDNTLVSGSISCSGIV
jgi:hypothetical protein